MYTHNFFFLTPKCNKWSRGLPSYSGLPELRIEQGYLAIQAYLNPNCYIQGMDIFFQDMEKIAKIWKYLPCKYTLSYNKWSTGLPNYLGLPNPQMEQGYLSIQAYLNHSCNKWIMEIFAKIWKQLTRYGNICQDVEVFGKISKQLPRYGNICQDMEIFAKIWKYLVNMEIAAKIWKYLLRYGSIW